MFVLPSQVTQVKRSVNFQHIKGQLEIVQRNVQGRRRLVANTLHMSPRRAERYVRPNHNVGQRKGFKRNAGDTNVLKFMAAAHKQARTATEPTPFADITKLTQHQVRRSIWLKTISVDKLEILLAQEKDRTDRAQAYDKTGTHARGQVVHHLGEMLRLRRDWDTEQHEIRAGVELDASNELDPGEQEDESERAGWMAKRRARNLVKKRAREKAAAKAEELRVRREIARSARAKRDRGTSGASAQEKKTGKKKRKKKKKKTQKSSK